MKSNWNIINKWYWIKYLYVQQKWFIDLYRIPPRYLKQTISNCTEYKIQLLKQPVQESEPTSFPIIYNNDTKESWASKMIFSYCKIEGKSRFMSIHWLYWLGRLSWRFSSAYLFSNMFCTHLITIPIQK